MTGERAEAAEADEKKEREKIMAVSYRLYQNNREGKFKGMWYARACHNGTVDIYKLADIMQANCTVKRSDILAVLAELVEVMTDQLQNSMRVKLNTLKVGFLSCIAMELVAKHRHGACGQASTWSINQASV